MHTDVRRPAVAPRRGDGVAVPLPWEELARLGLRPADVRATRVLREREGHAVYRIVCRDRSYVLKLFDAPDALEVQVYALLRGLGVAVLPVHGAGPQALLLEDLESSAEWRAASDADMAEAATGTAVAGWYRRLHEAGFGICADADRRPAFLRPWIDEITPAALETAGRVLGFSAEPAWATARAQAEALKARYRAFPQTFNYDDFAGENLALSRGGEPLRAVVYDYDCFSVGCAYSDWRNVTFSLQGAARDAFAQAYGPVSDAERRLDDPLAILQGLVSASRRSRAPGWALPLIRSVTNGELAEAIRRALP
jgi:hypothetical protein